MDEESFFKTYASKHKKEALIPGMEMNSPIATKTKTGCIGLELEMEGRNLQLGEGHFETIKVKSRANWIGVTDGSLRNGGREFVLSDPCNKDEVETLLNGLFKVIETNRGVIQNSNRCSTHVHINVGGKKINELTSILALWYVFEEALINWCGEERKANHFCLSLAESDSTLRAWKRYLETGQRPSQDGLKYSALNILPVWKFGSVEFRCGPAVDEATVPVKWSSFLADLVDFASSEFANPEHIASAVSERGPTGIFQDICAKSDPRFGEEVLSRMPNFEDSCMTGLRNAQPILLGFPWTEWMKEIDKEYVPNPFEKKGKLKIRPAAFDGWEAAPVRAQPAIFDEPVEPVIEAAPDMYMDRERQARYALYYGAYRRQGINALEASTRAQRQA